MSQEENPVLPINDLNSFAQLMTDWFTDCRAQIQYASSVPDDIVVKLMYQNEEIELNSKEKEIFRQGVKVAMEVFHKLPFDVVEQTEDSTDAASESSGS